MNSDIQPMNTPKYEKLEKGPNTQINKRNNSDNPQKLDSNLTSTSLPSTKHINVIAGKSHKLVDSKQVSGQFYQFDKKAFLLDTYARIVASNNRRCPKRLRELAKPKRPARSDQNNYATNFDLNYSHITKTYHTEDKRNIKKRVKEEIVRLS